MRPTRPTCRSSGHVVAGRRASGPADPDVARRCDGGHPPGCTYRRSCHRARRPARPTALGAQAAVGERSEPPLSCGTGRRSVSAETPACGQPLVVPMPSTRTAAWGWASLPSGTSLMNTSAPANYVIRIDGHLGEHCSASPVEVTPACGRRFDTRRRLTVPSSSPSVLSGPSDVLIR